jgi:hypothetical protein
MRPVLDPAGHRVPRTKPTCLLHTWRPHWRRPLALVLHLHQHQSRRNLHLQYLAKNQSTQRCQSLITQGSDHPPVLEPHMVLTTRGSHAVEASWPSLRAPRSSSPPRSLPSRSCTEPRKSALPSAPLATTIAAILDQEQSRASSAVTPCAPAPPDRPTPPPGSPQPSRTITGAPDYASAVQAPPGQAGQGRAAADTWQGRHRPDTAT